MKLYNDFLLKTQSFINNHQIVCVTSLGIAALAYLSKNYLCRTVKWIIQGQGVTEKVTQQKRSFEVSNKDTDNPIEKINKDINSSHPSKNSNIEIIVEDKFHASMIDKILASDKAAKAKIFNFVNKNNFLWVLFEQRNPTKEFSLDNLFKVIASHIKDGLNEIFDGYENWCNSYIKEYLSTLEDITKEKVLKTEILGKMIDHLDNQICQPLSDFRDFYISNYPNDGLGIKVLNDLIGKTDEIYNYASPDFYFKMTDEEYRIKLKHMFDQLLEIINQNIIHDNSK